MVSLFPIREGQRALEGAPGWGLVSGWPWLSGDKCRWREGRGRHGAGLGHPGDAGRTEVRLRGLACPCISKRDLWFIALI